MDVLNNFIITLIVGGLLVLAFLKLSNAIAVNRKANIYFGIFVLLWSSFWLDNILLSEQLQEKKTIFIITRLLQFLAPLAFYFSIIFYTKPQFQYKPKHLKYSIIPLLFLSLLLLRPFLQKNLFTLLYIIILPSHALLYTLLAYRVIQKHQKNIELFSSNKEPIDLNWIKYIILAFIISAALIIIYALIAEAQALNVYINAFFLCVVYFVAYFSIKQKEIFPKGYQIQTSIKAVQLENNNTKNKLITDPELELYKNKLLKLMKEEQPYLDSELNLVKLAQQLSISRHQLSYIINQGFGENFFYFVNKYRVQKAEELLSDPEKDKYTILAIGFESGFNSKTAFNTTFKKVTSYTPSEYRKKRSEL